MSRWCQVGCLKVSNRFVSKSFEKRRRFGNLTPDQPWASAAVFSPIKIFSGMKSRQTKGVEKNYAEAKATSHGRMQDILQWIISKLNVQTPHGRFFIVFRGPWNFTMNLPKMSVESCFEHFPSWTFTNFDTTKLGERHCEWRFFHFVENWRCTFCRLILQGPFHSKKVVCLRVAFANQRKCPSPWRGFGIRVRPGEWKEIDSLRKEAEISPVEIPWRFAGRRNSTVSCGILQPHGFFPTFSWGIKWSIFGR